MPDGRGQAQIRTSHPEDREDGKILSLKPEVASNIFRKERKGLDDGN